MPNGTQPHHADQRTPGIDCPPIRGKFPFRRSIGRIDTRLCNWVHGLAVTKSFRIVARDAICISGAVEFAPTTKTTTPHRTTPTPDGRLRIPRNLNRRTAEAHPTKTAVRAADKRIVQIK